MKTCTICKGEVVKAKTKIEVGGIVLMDDYVVEKCKSCGEEFMTLEQMSFLRKKAEEKGVWGYGLKLKRTKNEDAMDAVSELYKRGKITLRQASELLGLTLRETLAEFGKRKVYIRYGEKELAEDLG